ncbi:MAG: hypothetical protein V8R84_11930 [Eubacterium sp.]
MAELISGILTIIVCYLLGHWDDKLNLIIELHQTVITQDHEALYMSRKKKFMNL